MVSSLIESISLEGFQVVTKQMFDPDSIPLLTLWENYIGFSSSAYVALENCECIKVLLNEPKKKLILMPVNSSDSDAIKWRFSDKPSKFRRINCRPFTTRLMTTWHFDPKLKYRCYGQIMRVENKVVLVFDFNTAVGLSATTKGI